MEPRTKKLHYRRIIWNEPVLDADEERLSLAHLLLREYEQRLRTDQRQFVENQKAISGLRWKHADSRLFIHVAEYSPGQAASTLPKTSEEQNTETEEIEPPPGYEFLEGDIFAAIQGDHIVFCGHHARESLLKRFIGRIVVIPSDEPEFWARAFLRPPIRLETKRRIDEGVKSVRFSTTVLEMTERYSADQREPDKFWKWFGWLPKLIGEDQTPVDEKEDLTLELNLRYSGARRSQKDRGRSV